jgi:hypothetical protein
MKQCTKCGKEKDESEFHLRSGSKKSRSHCKACINEANLARQAANPEKYNARTNAWRAKNPGRASAISRAWQLRHPEQFRAITYRGKYNIDFESLWQAQDGKCASCHEPMIKGGKDPYSACADHDRSCCPGKKSCGKCVRGLIHRNCNLVLGYAKDDLKVLRGAVEYLERWAARPGDSAGRFSVHTACKGENREFDQP